MSLAAQELTSYNDYMKINNTDIKILLADITGVAAEAIVNPAHFSLQMNSGLAQVLKNKGGDIIEKEALEKGPLEAGNVVSTSGGGLPVKFIIHAVTMGDDKKTDEHKIRSACRNALELAENLKVSSVVFPALGCGLGGFTPKASAKIMAQEILRHVRERQSNIQEIIVCLLDEEMFDVFERNITGYLDYILNKLKSPFLTVDAIIEIGDAVVLIERSNPPFGLALPGGFVDYGESLEEAVIREAREETSLGLLGLKQFHVYSTPGRDPRFHTVTAVFSAKAEGIPRAGDDAAAVKVVPWNEIENLDFAFNHKEVLRDYLLTKAGKDPF